MPAPEFLMYLHVQLWRYITVATVSPLFLNLFLNLSFGHVQLPRSSYAFSTGKKAAGKDVSVFCPVLETLLSTSHI